MDQGDEATRELARQLALSDRIVQVSNEIFDARIAVVKRLMQVSNQEHLKAGLERSPIYLDLVLTYNMLSDMYCRNYGLASACCQIVALSGLASKYHHKVGPCAATDLELGHTMDYLVSWAQACRVMLPFCWKRFCSKHR